MAFHPSTLLLLLATILAATRAFCGQRSRRSPHFPPFKNRIIHSPKAIQQHYASATSTPFTSHTDETHPEKKTKKVVIIGAGWGGLSAAHALASHHSKENAATSSSSSSRPQPPPLPLEITLIDSSSRVGGLVRDGFSSASDKKRPAEAGQHGFWDNYHNIFHFLERDLLPRHNNLTMDAILSGYAEQGQYSKRRGLEAVWPVYREQRPRLPTGLAQAFYTRFIHLPLIDRLSAWPLVLAFSDFDDSAKSWEKYDAVSFHDLCLRLGVSRRCYAEAFEPMILTGLFAPGKECSAAAALGMAYFFVLRSQNSFDVRWCRGNIGEKIFEPWVESLLEGGVDIRSNTKVVGFEMNDADGSIEGDKGTISRIICTNQVDGKKIALEADAVVFAVGASALNAITRNSPELSQYSDFRRFANLRGTSVLATRIYLDRKIHIPYSANACFGFDEGIGMTMFDISTLHATGEHKRQNGQQQQREEKEEEEGTIVEVDYYHSSPLIVMNDDAILQKVKDDLDSILGTSSRESQIVDAAIIRLPNAVNWYFPGSYASMPDTRSSSISNAYFAGDLVKTRHGSWSQEKAFVTGIECANMILGKRKDAGIISLEKEEFHVGLGRKAVTIFKELMGGNSGALPLLADFLR